MINYQITTVVYNSFIEKNEKALKMYLIKYVNAAYIQNQ